MYLVTLNLQTHHMSRPGSSIIRQLCLPCWQLVSVRGVFASALSSSCPEVELQEESEIMSMNQDGFEPLLKLKVNLELCEHIGIAACPEIDLL